MRTKTAVEVMEAQVAVPDLKVRGNVYLSYVQDADALLDEGSFHRVPVLLGMNSGEGILFSPDVIGGLEYYN